MKNKLASTRLVAITVMLGICMTLGANLAYIFDQTINKELVYVMAMLGIGIVTWSLLMYVAGTAFGWYDKKEAKA